MIIHILLLGLASDTVAAVRHIPVAPRETLTVTIAAPARRESQARTTAPVVLLPGLLGASFGYRKVTRALVDSGHEVYVVEPLGTGSSSHPVDGDYSLDAQADRVSAALDSLGVGRAILVGSNFGASVAMRLAYQHPEHVAAVLSLDGGPIDRSYTAGVSVAMKLGPLLRLFGGNGLVRKRIRSSLIDASADPAWVTPDVVEVYAHPIASDLGAALSVMGAMRNARVSEPLRDNLWRITQPVRLLLGAANRRNGIESDEVALLREALRDFAADSVAGSGVYLHEERPDAVVAAVLSLSDALGAVAATARVSPR